MANTDIRFKITATGGLKEVAKDAKEINRNMKEAAASSMALSKAKANTTGGTFGGGGGGRGRGLTRGTTGVAPNGDTRDFARQAQGLGGLVHLYATFAANIFAVSTAFNALSKARDVTNMFATMSVMTEKTGINIRSLASDVQKLTNYGVSLEDSVKFTNMATSAGQTAEQMKELAAGAQAVSVVMGRDVNDALSRLTRGTAKLEPELLDELGILTRASEAYKMYAKEIGVSEANLTSFQKSQAYTNAVIKELQTKFGGEEDIRNLTNEYKQFQATFQETMQMILEGVNTVIGPFIKALSSSPTAMAAGIATMVAMLGNKALPILDQYKKRQLDAIKEVNEAASKQATSNIDPKLLQQQRRGKAELAKYEKTLNKTVQDDLMRQQETRLANLKTRMESLRGVFKTDANYAKLINESKTFSDLQVNRGKILNGLQTSLRNTQLAITKASAEELPVLKQREHLLKRSIHYVDKEVLNSKHIRNTMSAVKVLREQQLFVERQITDEMNKQLSKSHLKNVAKEAQLSGGSVVAELASNATSWSGLKVLAAGLREQYGLIMVAQRGVITNNGLIGTTSTGAFRAMEIGIARVRIALATLTVGLKLATSAAVGLSSALLRVMSHPAIMALTLAWSFFGDTIAKSLGFVTDNTRRLDESTENAKVSVNALADSSVKMFEKIQDIDVSNNSISTLGKEFMKLELAVDNSAVAAQAIENLKTKAHDLARFAQEEESANIFVKFWRRVRGTDAASMRDQLEQDQFTVMRARIASLRVTINNLKAPGKELTEIYTKMNRAYQTRDFSTFDKLSANATEILRASKDFAQTIQGAIKESDRGIDKLLGSTKAGASDLNKEMSNVSSEVRDAYITVFKGLDKATTGPDMLAAAEGISAVADRLKEAGINANISGQQIQVLSTITELYGKYKESLANKDDPAVSQGLLDGIKSLAAQVPSIANAIFTPLSKGVSDASKAMRGQIKLLERDIKRLEESADIRLSLGLDSPEILDKKYQKLSKIAELERQAAIASKSLSADEASAEYAEKVRLLNKQKVIDLVEQENQAATKTLDISNQLLESEADLLKTISDMGVRGYEDRLFAIESQVNVSKKLRDITNEINEIEAKVKGSKSQEEIQRAREIVNNLKSQRDNLEEIEVLSKSRYDLEKMINREVTRTSATLSLAKASLDKVLNSANKTSDALMSGFAAVLDAEMDSTFAGASKDLARLHVAAVASTSEVERLSAQTELAGLQANIVATNFENAKQAIESLRDTLITDSVALQSAEDFGTGIGIAFSRKFEETFGKSSLVSDAVETIFNIVNTGVDKLVEVLRGKGDLLDIFEAIGKDIRDTMYSALSQGIKKNIVEQIGGALFGDDFLESMQTENERLLAAIQEDIQNRTEVLVATREVSAAVIKALEANSAALQKSNTPDIGIPTDPNKLDIFGGYGKDFVDTAIDNTIATRDVEGAVTTGFKATITALAKGGKAKQGIDIIEQFSSIGSKLTNITGKVGTAVEFIGSTLGSSSISQFGQGFAGKLAPVIPDSTGFNAFGGTTAEGVSSSGLAGAQAGQLFGSIGAGFIGGQLGASLGKNEYTKIIGGAIGSVLGVGAAGMAGIGVGAAAGGMAGAMGAMAALGPYAAIGAVALLAFQAFKSKPKLNIGAREGLDGFEDNSFVKSPFGVNVGALDAGTSKMSGGDVAGLINSFTGALHNTMIQQLDIQKEEFGAIRQNLVGEKVKRNIHDERDFKITINDWIRNSTASIVDALASPDVSKTVTAAEGVEGTRSIWGKAIRDTNSEDINKVIEQSNRVIELFNIWERAPDIRSAIGITDEFRQSLFDTVDANLNFANKSDFVKDIANKLQISSEDFITFTEGVTNAFRQTTTLANSLGQSVTEAFGGTTDTRFAMIEAAGGLEAFTEKVKFFTENLVPEAERLRVTYVATRLALSQDVPVEGLTDALDLSKETILSMGSTSDGFYRLMSSLNDTNDAGGVLRAQMLDLAPSFQAAKESAAEFFQQLTGLSTDSIASSLGTTATTSDRELYSGTNGRQMGSMLVDEIMQGMFDSLVTQPIGQMITDNIITPILDSASGFDAALTDLDFTAIETKIANFQALMVDPQFISAMNTLASNVNKTGVMLRKAFLSFNMEFSTAVINLGDDMGESLSRVIEGITEAVYTLDTLDPSNIGSSFKSYFADPSNFLEENQVRSFGQYFSQKINESLMDSLILDPVANMLSSSISNILSGVMTSAATGAAGSMVGPIVAGGAAGGAGAGGAIAGYTQQQVGQLLGQATEQINNYISGIRVIINNEEFQNFMKVDLPAFINKITPSIQTYYPSTARASTPTQSSSSSSGSTKEFRSAFEIMIDLLAQIAETEDKILAKYDITSQTNIKSAYNELTSQLQKQQELKTEVLQSSPEFTQLNQLKNYLSRLDSQINMYAGIISAASAGYANYYQRTADNLQARAESVRAQIAPLEASLAEQTEMFTRAAEASSRLLQATLTEAKKDLDTRREVQKGNVEAEAQREAVDKTNKAIAEIYLQYSTEINSMLTNGVQMTTQWFMDNFGLIEDTIANSDFLEITQLQAEALAALADAQYELVEGEKQLFQVRLDNTSKLEKQWLELTKGIRDVDASIGQISKDLGDGGAYLRNMYSSLLSEAKGRLELAKQLGDTDTIIEAAGEVQSAMGDYYSAQLEQIESTIQFATDVSNFLNDLKFSDKSTLSKEEQLNEANRQFFEYAAVLQDTSGQFSAAQIEQAQSSILSVADTLLGLGREGFASGQGYVDIYNAVTGTLESLGVTGDVIAMQEQLDNTRNTILTEQLNELLYIKEILGTQRASVGDELIDSAMVLSESVATLTDLGFWGSVAESFSASLSVVVREAISSGNYAPIEGSYDIGTAYVPKDMVAKIHKGERILTAGENREIMDALTNPNDNAIALSNEVRKLREEVVRLRQENNDNAAKIAGTVYSSSLQSTNRLVQATENSSERTAQLSEQAKRANKIV